MNIGLIYCPYGEGNFNTFGKSHWTSQIHPGLCSIGAYSKMKGYKNIHLIDLRKLSSWEHFRHEIKKIKLDVAGVTMMSSDFNNATKAINIIKEENFRTVVVAGGVHPTVAPDEVAFNKNVDHVVVGEGEITFVDILDSLRKNEGMNKILTGIPAVLDNLPFEDRELFDYKVTTSFASNFPGIFEAPSVTIIASRGCPYKCTFCAPHAKTMFGPRVRYRSVDNVIEELKILRQKYHFKSIFFWDYSITLNKDWMYEFAEKYKANGFEALISANARADAICRNKNAIKELSKVGFKMLHIGYESGSQRMLDFLEKGITVEESLKATEICKENGIIVRGLFMLGLPTETKDDIQKTMDFIKRARPQIYSFSYFTPVPGSSLYDYCKEKDLSLIKNHDELADYGPSRPKIKGVDYEYLRTVVEESFGLKFRSRLLGKIMLLVHTKLKRGKTRYFFIWLYSKWVKFTMGRVSKP
jgi:radical SAM superfamily enzyme YgiQ (UPF0313 family)